MSDKGNFGDIPVWESPEMIQLWQKMTLDERAEKLGQLIQAGRELMMEGIKLREPGLSNYETRTKLKELMYAQYNNSHA